MSKILELRKVTEFARLDDQEEKRSITEELRVNHIETLEQLQLLTDENDSLRKSLSMLKKDFENGNENNTEEDEGPTDSQDDSSILLRKIDLQDQEIKSLKSRLLQAEGETKDIKQMSNLSRQQEFELRKNTEKATNEAVLNALNVSKLHIASCEDIIQQLKTSIQLKEEEYLATSTSESKVSQQIIKDSQDETFMLKEQVTFLRETSETSERSTLEYQERLLVTINQLKNEKECIIQEQRDIQTKNDLLLEDISHEKASFELKFSSLQIENNSYTLEISKLKAEILTLEATNLRLTENLEQLIIQSSNSFLTETTLLSVPSLTMQERRPSVVGVIENNDGDFQIGGKGFDEFVKLKKENKTLRLQIAHLQTHSRGSGSGSFSSSSSNNNNLNNRKN